MTDSDPLDSVYAAIRNASYSSSDYDLNPGTVLPPGRVLRPAAVLVPVLVVAGRARVYLTKRSSALKHHPGQVAFPGGKVDRTDRSVTDAALREASEEIGLDPANVDVLGQLPNHETVTGFDVTPIVGRIRDPFDPVPEAGEVEEVFDVSLDHLMRAAHYSVQSRMWRGNRRHYFTVPFGPYYIWGATARILKAMADAAEDP